MSSNSWKYLNKRPNKGIVSKLKHKTQGQK